MAKRRREIDIVAQILVVSQQRGASKSAIMFGSELAFGRLNRYLDLLVSRELLRYDPEARCYATTEKGLFYLDTYDEVNVLAQLAQLMK